MTLNAKIGGFMNFFMISGCDTSLYHSQGGTTELQFSAKLLNRNCYWLSRVSWALSQISC